MAETSISYLQSTCARWKAIAQRDPTAHFSFIYGVMTTRIYCRPTCTARVARRANVVYFETPAEARLEGFKPCTKCKPDDAMFMGQREEIVLRTLGLLHDDMSTAGLEGGVKALAKGVGVTPSYLCRVFKIMMGCTISQYRRQFEDKTTTIYTGTTTCTMPEDVTSAASSNSVHSTTEPCLSIESFPRMPAKDPVHPRMSFSVEDSGDLDLDIDEWLWTENTEAGDWDVGQTPLLHQQASCD